MITLPARRRLENRRHELYEHLRAILHYAPVQQVEHIMRQIHCINLKIITYYQREREYEQKKDNQWRD